MYQESRRQHKKRYVNSFICLSDMRTVVIVTNSDSNNRYFFIDMLVHTFVDFKYK